RLLAPGREGQGGDVIGGQAHVLHVVARLKADQVDGPAAVSGRHALAVRPEGGNLDRAGLPQPGAGRGTAAGHLGRHTALLNQNGAAALWAPPGMALMMSCSSLMGAPVGAVNPFAGSRGQAVSSARRTQG